MTTRLLVATRKGLFHLDQGASGWAIDHVSFLGQSVSMTLPDPRDGALYAALNLGHFGVKLHRSRDAGKTWQELAAPAFPKQPEGQTDVLPGGVPWPWRVEQIWSLEAGRAPGELWCGTIPGGLFRSTDHGDSWHLVEGLWNHPKRKEWFGGGADFPGIHSICVDATGVTVGVSCGGVWRSTDDGATWEIRATGMFAEFMPPERQNDPYIQDPHRIAQCPARPEALWAQHHNGVFRSVDGGLAWTSIPDAAPSTFGFAVAVHPRDPDTAWFIPAQKDDMRVPVEARVVASRTRDGGKTFEVLGRGLPQEHAYDIVYRHALDVDASGDKLAFGSTTGSLWTTENQGDAWQRLDANLPPIYGVRFLH